MPPFLPPIAASNSLPMRLLLIGGIIAVIYLGRAVLAPLALAMLLTIAALPMVAWIERRGMPRIPTVLFTMAVFVSAAGGLVYLVVSQALSLAAELPGYENVLRGKVQALSEGSGPIEGVSRLFHRLGAAMQPGAPPAQTVTVASPEAAPYETVLSFIGMVVGPLATVAMTLLLMTFILVQREDVRDRALRLAGLHELHRTTEAMTDTTGRLGRFLLMQVVVNSVFGLSMGIGLWLIGVPNAPLWGVLGSVLRFIPYLGAPLSLVFPLVVAFATTEGWNTVLMVLALFIVVDVILSYGVEPWLFGHSTGVTPLALVLSSAFWAVLWGPIGLVLAPAITACLVILGRHIPSLSFLDVLLSDSPALPVEARFYQRLLAGDEFGASRLLAAESERRGVLGSVERMVLPAIAQIGHGRPDETFSANLAIRGARTLKNVLDTMTDASIEHPEILVLPIAGALDRAAASALVAALLEVGHPATTDVSRATDPTLVILAAAGATPAHRVVRALRDARRISSEVLVFITTDEAARAIAATGQATNSSESLTTLMPRIDALLDQTEVAA
ncbi:AI-2E family transporter [Plastoroseomonas arctica]|uniref:AI-2E family transporter n=1 Tax=Plastoroseomonas arctica TaxID=1509237 RepID=A0AAF1JX93_9PROT|nr:AI-2E family transporter [Plastoroseomonas arctica]MBR0655951.1 AI-2E family transporter [Plastoroseomonas arctica]